jgi:3-deoxy-D-manno-octulosonic-acid transferase
MRRTFRTVGMGLYSLALLVVLVVGSPYWLARMLTSGRYREGLAGRLGWVPAELRAAVTGRRIVWVHAVSVGEVLAASSLVRELDASLNAGLVGRLDADLRARWVIVVSTTTATGQALARERFGSGRVFFYPLDFAWAVRAHLEAIKPKLLVLMESELWPRMLVECERACIPVAVVNARVSDRSLRRGKKMRAVWARVLRQVGLYAAQSEDDRRRLVALGARPERVNVTGNLKYDVRAAVETSMLRALRPLFAGRRVVVAGSLLEPEEELLLTHWWEIRSAAPDAILVLAPRHPERFNAVAQLVEGTKSAMYRASELATRANGAALEAGAVVVLDTIGDLASVYGLADVAFVGGSLVKRGGHNPLEPAQFGVPVIMGSSFENFREIVQTMRDAGGISIVQDMDSLTAELVEYLTDREAGRATGERGRAVFEAQSGATSRTVKLLTGLVSKDQLNDMGEVTV